jgi:hypothetical protein
METETLYQYLLSRIPFLGASLLQQDLISYSNELKRYLHTPISTKSSLKHQIYQLLNHMYDVIETDSGNSQISELNRQNIKKYTTVLNENNMEKNVYISNQNVIKRSKEASQQRFPYLFIEILIHLILQYESDKENKRYIPEFHYFHKVMKRNHRNNKNTITYNYRMERIEGMTLHEYIHSNSFTWDGLKQILIKVCEILQYFQEKCNFVHGDLNTSNVMIRSFENGIPHVQFIDFGYSIVYTPYLNQEPLLLTTFYDNHLEKMRMMNIQNDISKSFLFEMDMKHLYIHLMHDLQKTSHMNIIHLLKETFPDPFIRSTTTSKYRIKNVNQVHNLVRTSEYSESFKPSSFINIISNLSLSNHFNNQSPPRKKLSHSNISSTTGQKPFRLFENNNNNELLTIPPPSRSNMLPMGQKPSRLFGNNNNDNNENGNQIRRKPLFGNNNDNNKNRNRNRNQIRRKPLFGNNSNENE